ncbi:hypothetical protein SESBI_34028 [Sesbania bispinosa]|nr:hypothetical protein SESBI_34028 [Sesbania bispinosa]
MESSRRAVESYRWSRLIDSATSDEDKITPALRLIKYAVGKSGVEFRREMQRHSVAFRQFVHYKGQLDPLKGDALNKAVRDTAHEAISAIFSEDNNNKPSPAADNLSQRIQGEVVGLGSASIKQGFNTLTRGHSSFFKNETTGNGTYNYKSPNLHTSFTAETEHCDRYEPVVYRGEIQSTSSGSGLRNQASKATKVEISNGDSDASYLESKTREDRLLETVVRMKAVCVLESILRKKDNDHFSPMASYFSENNDVVLRCSESPQASLREKANKHFGHTWRPIKQLCYSEEAVKEDSATVAELPDLIDTGDSKDYHGTGDTAKNTNDQNTANLTPLTPLALVDDLLGNFIDSGEASNELKSDDPFADVLFHSSENKEHADDVFSGMTVGNNKQGCPVNHGPGNRSEPEIDIFASNSRNGNHKEFVDDSLAGLTD